MADVERIHPLNDQLFAASKVLIKPGEAHTRISLRAGEEQIEAVNQVLSMSLPDKPKSSNSRGERIAMWLGPDEWLILDNEDSNIKDLPSDLAHTLCSAVDISHRNTSISLIGANSADVINAGCPQDLSLDNFPVGGCSRTVLGKSEIILLRKAKNSFHIECWRSFSDYVWKYLVEAAKTQ
jgi:sarcosine oxidase subunit gamma